MRTRTLNGDTGRQFGRRVQVIEVLKDSQEVTEGAAAYRYRNVGPDYIANVGGRLHVRVAVCIGIRIRIRIRVRIGIRIGVGVRIGIRILLRPWPCVIHLRLATSPHQRQRQTQHRQHRRRRQPHGSPRFDSSIHRFQLSPHSAIS